MVKYLLSFLMVFGFAISGFSQKSYELSLKITDDTDPLIGATVIVLSKPEGVMISFGVTDNNGNARLGNIPSGNHTLQITYLGFGTFERELKAEGEEKKLDFGTIVLKPDSEVIDGVVITEEFVPIKISKDTIEYNADAFKLRANASVEELLKRLPGIEVDREGNIEAQGQQVQSVLVDGKEFFGRDPKMATKNLPAEAIKKVQVYDRKSESAMFTGVDDGQEEKTINLQLKEGFKKGSFGNVTAGYGTDDRFNTKLSLNRFSSKTQMSLLGNFNNINKVGLDWGDVSNIAGGGFRGGGNFGGGGIINQGNNIGEIISSTGGLNLNHEFSKNTKLSTSYFLSYSDRLLLQDITSENALITGLFYSDESLKNANQNLRHNFNMTYDMNIDSTQKIRIVGRGSLQSADTDRFNQAATSLGIEDNIVTSSEQSSVSDQKSHNVNIEFDYNKKFAKRGRNISFEGRFSDGLTDLLSLIDNENLFYDGIGEVTGILSILQRQVAVTENQSINGKLSYTEPIARNSFLTGSFQYTNRNNDRFKDFFDRDPETQMETLNEVLSNSFDNTFNFFISGLNFRRNTATANYNLGLNYKISDLNGIGSMGSQINRRFNFFLPAATLDLDKPNLRFQYRTNVNEPRVDQLQPVLDNSDPLNLFQGNPDLIPEYSHNLSIRYIFFNSFDFTSLFAFINANYTTNNIITARTIDENFVNFSTPINVANRSNLSGSISYGRPIRALKINTRTSLRTNFGRDINFINDAEDFVYRNAQTISLRLDNRKKDVLDVALNLSYSRNGNIYAENRNLNNQFSQYGVNPTANVNLGKGWNMDTEFIYDVFSQERFGDDNSIAIWNANISKLFMNNKLQLSLNLFDVLNQNIGFSRVAQENFVRETISNNIGRYFMITAQYNLRGFNQESGSRRGSMMRMFG
jgi:hypothetical protein